MGFLAQSIRWCLPLGTAVIAVVAAMLASSAAYAASPSPSPSPIPQGCQLVSPQPEAVREAANRRISRRAWTSLVTRARGT